MRLVTLFALISILVTACSRSSQDPILGFRMGSTLEEWSSHKDSLIGIGALDHDGRFSYETKSLEESDFCFTIYLNNYGGLDHHEIFRESMLRQASIGLCEPIECEHEGEGEYVGYKWTKAQYNYMYDLLISRYEDPDSSILDEYTSEFIEQYLGNREKEESGKVQPNERLNDSVASVNWVPRSLIIPDSIPREKHEDYIREYYRNQKRERNKYRHKWFEDKFIVTFERSGFMANPCGEDSIADVSLDFRVHDYNEVVDSLLQERLSLAKASDYLSIECSGAPEFAWKSYPTRMIFSQPYSGMTRELRDDERSIVAVRFDILYLDPFDDVIAKIEDVDYTFKEPLEQNEMGVYPNISYNERRLPFSGEMMFAYNIVFEVNDPDPFPGILDLFKKLQSGEQVQCSTSVKKIRFSDGQVLD